MTKRMNVNFYRKETIAGQVDVWAIDETDLREKLKQHEVIDNPESCLIARNGFIDRTNDLIENIIGVKKDIGLKPIPIDVIPVLVREAPGVPTAN